MLRIMNRTTSDRGAPQSVQAQARRARLAKGDVRVDLFVTEALHQRMEAFRAAHPDDKGAAMKKQAAAALLLEVGVLLAEAVALAAEGRPAEAAALEERARRLLPPVQARLDLDGAAQPSGEQTLNPVPLIRQPYPEQQKPRPLEAAGAVSASQWSSPLSGRTQDDQPDEGLVYEKPPRRSARPPGPVGPLGQRPHAMGGRS